MIWRASRPDEDLAGDLLANGAIEPRHEQHHGAVEGVLLPNLDGHARPEAEGVEEADDLGVGRARNRHDRNVTGLEVTGKRVKVERGLITEYRVEMKLIFLLDD